jgi:hypothetical protein
MKRRTKEQVKLVLETQTLRELSRHVLAQVQGGFGSDDPCTAKKSGCATSPI